MKQAFKVYDFTLPANGSQLIYAIGEYFRVQTALGSLDVTVEGYGTLPSVTAGQGLRETPYQKLLLRDTSGLPNTGTILCSGSEFIDNRTFGVNSLDAATIAALTRPAIQSAAFADASAIVANTPLTVFNAASNPNGAVLLSADIAWQSADYTYQCFLSKATAPASVTDGSVYVGTHLNFLGASAFGGGCLPSPAYIPAGHGLYFIGNFACAAAIASARACRYKLL